MKSNQPNSPLEDIHHYLSGPFQNTLGWCSENVWQTLIPIVTAHCKIGLSAPVAEIGPYHGKFFWGLVKSTLCQSGHLAVDIFDEDSENADCSGVVGNRDIFIQNGRQVGCSEADVTIVTQDSMQLTAASVRALYAQKDVSFSFFSVDGAHHKDYVRHDFELSLELTHHDGVIIVDDYGNPRWHCVQEVVAERFFNNPPGFVPLAFSCNKLFLCHKERLEEYRLLVKQYVLAQYPATKVFETERFGYLGLTILPDMHAKITDGITV